MCYGKDRISLVAKESQLSGEKTRHRTRIELNKIEQSRTKQKRRTKTIKKTKKKGMCRNVGEREISPKT